MLFQLTSSRRGWPEFDCKDAGKTDISTHILTKRMTVEARPPDMAKAFQLTSSRRGWPIPMCVSAPNTIFQLTSSRRGWPEETVLYSYPEYFNSHPHEEDDFRNNITNTFNELFQLTSSRRGWLFLGFFTSDTIAISTHILTKRMTNIDGWDGIISVYFNSHPHE